MSNDSGALLFVSWVALITYWASSGDTTTVRISERVCTIEGAIPGSCGKSALGETYKFVVNHAKQSVAAIRDDRGASRILGASVLPGIHENCRVVDSANWRCEDDGTKFGMADGEYSASNRFGRWSFGVTGWRYWIDAIRR